MRTSRFVALILFLCLMPSWAQAQSEDSVFVNLAYEHATKAALYLEDAIYLIHVREGRKLPEADPSDGLLTAREMVQQANLKGIIRLT